MEPPGGTRRLQLQTQPAGSRRHRHTGHAVSIESAGINEIVSVASRYGDQVDILPLLHFLNQSTAPHGGGGQDSGLAI